MDNLLYELTGDHNADMDDWLASRPEHIRGIAERYTPNRLFRIRETGQRAIVYSICEHADGPPTLKVKVLACLNSYLPLDFMVFGISPDDLDPEPVTDADRIEVAAWQIKPE